MGYFFAQPGDFFLTSFEVIRDAYSALFRGAVYDWQAATPERSIRPITETLVNAVPLILAGLGIAIGFRSGMLNIGGQGQIILGATCAAFIGYAYQLPWVRTCCSHWSVARSAARSGAGSPVFSKQRPAPMR